MRSRRTGGKWCEELLHRRGIGVRRSADPLQETVEGRAEPRLELGEGGAVGAREGGFLLRYKRMRG